MNILVVDDDFGLLTLFSQVLQEAGFQVQTASNGRQGLEIFRRWSGWSLVILDRTLPGIGGEELAARIKESTPDLPIILISGFVDAVANPQLFQQRLLKPFLPSTLVKCVELVLGEPPVRR